MGHARINLQRMMSWIEGQIESDGPLPTDNQICDHFGFTSTEHARTLLAELADAGRITIKGYGPTRKIALGRERPGGAAGSGGVQPATRVDPVVERGVAKIAEIIKRKPASVSPKAPAGEPALPREEPVSGKSIMLPASADTAIAAVVARAKDHDMPLGQAAADLIVAGLAAGAKPIPADPAPAEVGLAAYDFHSLLAELGRRFEQAKADDTVTAELAAAIVRADAAEAKLAKMREALAA